jgi:hypothetical protein
MKMRSLWFFVVMLTLSLGACGTGKQPAPPPPCDQQCMDGVAVRALRDTMKLAYNRILLGKAVGTYEAGTPPYASCVAPDGGLTPGVPCPCPLGGTIMLFGQATSNAIQGATMVQLTYVLDHCQLSTIGASTKPETIYKLTMTGTATENGTIAVQPTANTSLDIKSDTISFAGTVYDPPIDYESDNCQLVLGQNGNDLSGTLCGRDCGTSL